MSHMTAVSKARVDLPGAIGTGGQVRTLRVVRNPRAGTANGASLALASLGLKTTCDQDQAALDWRRACVVGTQPNALLAQHCMEVAGALVAVSEIQYGYLKSRTVIRTWESTRALRRLATGCSVR